MRIKIDELKSKMLQALTVRGLSKEEADMVIEPFLEAEMRGKKTHGLSKFYVIDEALSKREGKPEIVKDKFNYSLINAHKELGYITAQFATDVLIKKTKEYGNAMVGVVNSYYFSMAGVYATKLAKAGLIGIITSNGGPSGVTSYGGTTPIFGTNPLAIAIPTKQEPILLDMATSEKAWGEINLAKVENRQLPDNVFLNEKGEFTTSPAEVNGVIPFGGAKGSGLNFMLEILTGAFVGGKMGLQASSIYDLGFFFMAFSPEMFTSMDEFYEKVEILKQEVKSSKTLPGFSEVYLPGEQSEKKLQIALQEGIIEVKDEVWNKLCMYAEGKNLREILNISS